MLRAFDKHGIFKWDAIIADPAFPFRKIAQEKQKEIKESKSKTKEEKIEKEKIPKAEGDEDEEIDDDMYDEDDVKGDGSKKKKKEARGKKIKRKTSLLSQLDLPRDTVFLLRINFLVSAVSDILDTFTSEYVI